MTSPPTRAEWIEIEKDGLQIKVPVSPPTRAEWIEIKIRLSQEQFRLRLRPHGRSGLKSEALL